MLLGIPTQSLNRLLRSVHINSSFTMIAKGTVRSSGLPGKQASLAAKSMSQLYQSVVNRLSVAHPIAAGASFSTHHVSLLSATSVDPEYSRDIDIRRQELNNLTGISIHSESVPLYKSSYLMVYETVACIVVDIGPMGFMGRGLMSDLIELPDFLSRTVEQPDKPVLIVSIGDKARLKAPFGSGGDLKEVYMHTLQLPESESRVREWVDLTFLVKKSLWSDSRPWGVLLLPGQDILGLTFETLAALPTTYSDGSKVCCPQKKHGIPNRSMKYTEILLTHDNASDLTDVPDPHLLDDYSKRVDTMMPVEDFSLDSVQRLWETSKPQRLEAVENLETHLDQCKDEYVKLFSDNAGSIQGHIERVINSDSLNKALHLFSDQMSVSKEDVKPFIKS